MKCPGWKQGGCSNVVQYRLRWSYNGARRFPSEHDFCGPCAVQCEQWLRRLETERSTSVRLEWQPLLPRID